MTANWRGNRCYKCGVMNGKNGAVVMEATALEVVAHNVPVGVSLCTEHAFIPDEPLAALVLGPEQMGELEKRRKQIAADLVEDLKVDAAEMAAWSNTFGNW